MVGNRNNMGPVKLFDSYGTGTPLDEDTAEEI